LNAAELIAQGSKNILASSKRLAILSGIIMVIGGAIWLSFSWNITTTSLKLKLDNVLGQIYLVAIGIILIYFGFMKVKSRRLCEIYLE